MLYKITYHYGLKDGQIRSKIMWQDAKDPTEAETKLRAYLTPQVKTWFKITKVELLDPKGA